MANFHDGQRLLYVLRGANLQATTDQTFAQVGTLTNWMATFIIANQVSGGATVTCAGGIYSAATKGGNAWVAATQSWINLSAAGKIVQATLAAVAGTSLANSTPILSLTTGSTAAVTADVFIYGVILD